VATPHLSTDTHETIAAALADGRPFALAVVLKTTGSVPREAGAKALIDAEGTIQGTIGGGLLEAEAQRLAVQAMKTGEPTLFDFRFTGASASLNEPICGGTMRVLVDPTLRDARDAYAAAAEAVRLRTHGVLVTQVEYAEGCIAHLGAAVDASAAPNSEPSVRVEVKWWGAGRLPSRTAASQAIEAALSKGVSQHFQEMSSNPRHFVTGIAEPVLPAARLLIAGGGHVGRALAEHALLVGFEVIVVEDRAHFAQAERYPPGVITRHGEFAEALRDFPIDEQTYVAIVGRGHPVDMKALVACLNSRAAYIGMMGSRRKIALARKALIESGQAGEEQLARVYAPIGLNLGAETVPEIAASIVAQLVAVRRTGCAPRFYDS
jgi:xanthine dehydrogenase accessory factor